MTITTHTVSISVEKTPEGEMAVLVFPEEVAEKMGWKEEDVEEREVTVDTKNKCVVVS
jgi:hypothetical protein